MNIIYKFPKLLIYIYTIWYIFGFIVILFTKSVYKCLKTNCKFKNDIIWKIAYFTRTLIFVILISKLVYSNDSSLLYILPLLIIFHIMYLIFYSHQSIFKDNLLFGIPLLNLLWVILFTISFIIIAIREYNKSKETKETIHQT